MPSAPKRRSTSASTAPLSAEDCTPLLAEREKIKSVHRTHSPRQNQNRFRLIGSPPQILPTFYHIKAVSVNKKAASLLDIKKKLCYNRREEKRKEVLL
jgi:hypothetical protein